MRDIRKYTYCLENSIKKELKRPYGFGCVSYFTQGSHDDMDYKTFEASAKSITTSFIETNWSQIKDFRDLKNRGIVIEKNMFGATKGINTHKGLIFLQLFLAYAYVFGVKWSDLENFIRKFSTDLRDDYQKENKAIIWKENGLRDIRNYPLTGFKEIIDLVDSLSINPMNDTRLTIFLIAHIDDTTTFHRSDLETLVYIQEKAKEILEVEDKRVYEREIKKLDDFYVNNRISSGGVADLFTTIRTLELLREDFYV